jgi:hypothetical protein
MAVKPEDIPAIIKTPCICFGTGLRIAEKHLAPLEGVTIIRLKESDIEKFRKFAPELWVTWAKKLPLAMKAFKSQWEFLKSIKVGYYTEADMVDAQGKKITL